MEIQDILTLIQAVDEHGLTELKLDRGDVKLSLKREEKAPQILNVTGADFAVSSGMTMMSGAAAVQPGAAESALHSSFEKQEAGEIASDNVIHSPLVGIFYNASSPEAEVFVKVGDSVKKGQVMGIIEAMKLMNEIECEFDGVVEAILVDNESVVEYGQPLFRIH